MCVCACSSGWVRGLDGERYVNTYSAMRSRQPDTESGHHNHRHHHHHHHQHRPPKRRAEPPLSPWATWPTVCADVDESTWTLATGGDIGHADSSMVSMWSPVSPPPTWPATTPAASACPHCCPSAWPHRSKRATAAEHCSAPACCCSRRMAANAVAAARLCAHCS